MPKILIADDDPLIRLLLKETLAGFTDRGVTLLTVNDGIDALETIKREEPDLVILDVMMPRMNGFEVCNIVKKKLSMQHIFIIVLSAKGQELDKQKASEYGADFYITKPFSIDEVIKKTCDVLGMQLK